MIDVVSTELQDAITSNRRAADLFNVLSTDHQQQYIGWVVAATTPDLRARRARQVVAWLETSVAQFRD